MKSKELITFLIMVAVVFTGAYYARQIPPPKYFDVAYGPVWTLEDKRPHDCMINSKKPQPKTSACMEKCDGSKAAFVMVNSGNLTEGDIEYTPEDFGPCPIEE